MYELDFYTKLCEDVSLNDHYCQWWLVNLELLYILIRYLLALLSDNIKFIYDENKGLLLLFK